MKTGRGELSAKVGTRIRKEEFTVWASEFDENINFELGHQICEGEEVCTLLFRL